MANIQDNVNEVVRDLRNKIDSITAVANDAEDDSNRDKIEEIKNMAIRVLSNASDKVLETYQSLSNPEEVEKGISIVKVKSKELYDNAIKKIGEVKNSKAYNDTIDYVKKTADQVVGETKDFIEGTKNNIDEFFEKPEVKKSIDNAKLKTVNVAEKALATLKQWLKPEDED